jgi:hypothetical protein
LPMHAAQMPSRSVNDVADMAPMAPLGVLYFLCNHWLVANWRHGTDKSAAIPPSHAVGARRAGVSHEETRLVPRVERGADRNHRYTTGLLSRWSQGAMRTFRPGR